MSRGVAVSKPCLPRYALCAVAGLGLLTVPLEAGAVGSKNYPGRGHAWPGTLPPSPPPAGNSPSFVGLDFSGASAAYENADTWYFAWTSNDKLLSPFTDGSVGSLQVVSHTGADAMTGNAVVTGSDPLHLTVGLAGSGATAGSALPYRGRYPSASLFRNGVWYYGTYTLDDLGGASCGGVSFCAQGPFVGFRTSLDEGVSWTDGPHTPSSPLFGESGQNGGKVKLGPLHAVDFGKNMVNAPGGKAYFVGHGACDDSTLQSNWIAGDCIYLVRVTPTVSNINSRSAYQYFAGFMGATPSWTSNMSAMKPLFKWASHAGNVSITYDQPLNKFLMSMSAPADRANSGGPYDAAILEADAIEGPWRLVQYLPKFGPQAYFLTIPSKFISADGLTFWLVYSANFSTSELGRPEDSKYALTLREVTLRTASDPQPLQLLYSPTRLDKFSAVTTDGLSDGLVGSDYTFERTEAYVLPVTTPPPAGTVPLRLYWSAARNDNLLVSTPQGIDSAVAAGYVLKRTEGLVFSSPQADTIPLKLYWSNARQDNLLLATAEEEEVALASGYVFIRNEGHALRRGPVPLRLFWSDPRSDNLTGGTLQNAVAAHATGYGSVVTVGLALPYPDAGLIPLKLFWSNARQDNALVASAAGQADVMAAGYTFVGTQGFVHPTQQPGTVPLDLFWSSARNDNDTVTSAFGMDAVALAAGYQRVRTEGFVLPNQ